MQQWIWQLDGWIVAAGILASVAAALLGNFLVLRRMSLLGDAISHAVLPGLAAAFFLSHSRSSPAMFVGAVVVGIATALLTDWVRGTGAVDEGAAMGIVFTSLFALGLVMIVQAADQVDLDPGCVLYGAIEMTPLDTWPVFGWHVPRVVLILGVVTAVNAIFLLLFYKELTLSSFDPALATTMGFHSAWMHYLLMALVAVTAVASFEAVGSILVVAMLVVPPATAFLLVYRLPAMILWSVAIAALSAVLGHGAALELPAWFGFRSTSTAGMMAVSAGMLFFAAACFAPRQGLLVVWAQQRLLAWRILAEDLLALFYRQQERTQGSDELPRAAVELTRAQLAKLLLCGRRQLFLLLAWYRRRGLLQQQDGRWRLTPAGLQRGSELVRSHRLWEQYLVTEAGAPTERIHNQAERLEHFTGRALRDRLHAETSAPGRDPHGRRIPPESAQP